MKIVCATDAEFNYATEAQLDSIFFEASSIRSFATEADKASFRHMWLGQYLEFDKAHCFVALDTAGSAAGYVVGSLLDPALSSRFADLAYFRLFARHTARYPAHLHINIAPHHRSAGLGAKLIEAFCQHAEAAGIPGVHVVTGLGFRNVGFYARNGFNEVARAPWRSGEVVMLARPLGGTQAGGQPGG